MIDRAALLADLKRQVIAVEQDLARQLTARTDVAAPLRDEYAQAWKLKRTAATWTAWRDERITQVAVAWVLGTVFVRFCEDNELIAEPYLSGPSDERRELAQARYEAYVEGDPDPTYRGWLESAFAELGAGQAGKLLFDPVHNPLFQIPLSHDGAHDLIDFWRLRDESGSLTRDFTDPLCDDGVSGWDTRFLGDLYQDLSENARKQYALLQTPEFVEEFILDRTMTPALREFGYDDFRMIDPTCGSGHFVLGAFGRLVRVWSDKQPSRDRHERVRAALNSVHGVDINPFAVAIARFRLLVAAMAAANIRTLAQAAGYEWPIHIAVGDSLIKARQLELTLDGGRPSDPLAEFSYATEDVQDHSHILRPGRYHVVVGNPPYITVKDKNLNRLYRELYKSCSGKYALSVPFAERFFELAVRGESDSGYGRVGQITSNSFMKREFGTKLIEQFFGQQVELTEVIDTSGAYIPGHGTPTVILIGTRRSGNQRAATVRTVRSVQGEPKAPQRAEDGLVWSAIVDQIDSPGTVSKWVSVDDLYRTRYFAKQPWILLDGGLEISESIEEMSTVRLKSVISGDVGFASFSGADEAFYLPARWHEINCTPSTMRRPMIVGEDIRDWSAIPNSVALVTHRTDGSVIGFDADSQWGHHLWRYKQITGRLTDFGGKSRFELHIPWWSWYRWVAQRYRTPRFIAFSHVATHMHAAFDASGMAYNQHSPVVKLPEGATEGEHLRLLGLLNSSTACFWLKMVSHSKGNGGIGGGISDEFWEHRFEFTGTKLEEFPLPSSFPIELGANLDQLSNRLAAATPSAIVATSTPTIASLRATQTTWHALRAEMIASQEELDWQVYSIYQLLDLDLRAPVSVVPEIALGERAFEIVLARRIVSGEASHEWFTRHGSSPITEIPARWPESYREVVQRRIDVIESNRAIGMIERPEYKRRWATDGWDVLQQNALRSWLLDRIEQRELWFDDNDQPVIRSSAWLTSKIAEDEEFVSVASIYAPRVALAHVLADLIAEEHVPFVAALRYKPSGLKKRADWEEVWDQQRLEDAAPDEQSKRRIRDRIPAPPKYTQADFLRSSFWTARGKLDVSKERFISYGSTNAASPDLYGWAGWDHREQAHALASYFSADPPPPINKLQPLLSGLLELQPWLDQSHNEFHETYGGSPAGFFATHRRTTQARHGWTDDDLRAWRPVAATRARRSGG